MSSVPLKDFVTETLKSIAVGVREAQEYSRDEKGILIGLFSVGGKAVDTGDQLIHFEISLQAEKTLHSEASGGASGTLISVVTAKVTGSVGDEHKSHSTHKVQFSVPMQFHAYWPETEK
ncbi:MAG: hypothetical protein AAF755_03430 [Pseudomonadota bacterium]